MKQLILLLILPFLISAQPTLNEIDEAFDRIGTNYGVPAPLLKAFSYSQTKWNTLHSHRGGYGLMALKARDQINSVAFGAKLTGYTESEGIIDYTKNIEMGAAILVMLRNNAIIEGKSIESIEDYYPLMLRFFDRDQRIQKFTADEILDIYRLINDGYSVTRSDDPGVTIKGTPIDFARMAQILPPLPYATIDEISGLDDIQFIASQNYSSRSGTTIDQVILHIMQGSMSGSISWFQNSSAQASAHYMISQKGEIVQMVKLDDKAWHASAANPRSIGIEHEGYWMASYHEDLPFTDIEYRASAMLTRWLCDKYNIPKVHRAAFTWNDPSNPSAGGTVNATIQNQPGILGHRDATGKWICPGDWDWDYFMPMVIGYSEKSGTAQFLRPLDGSKTTNPVILQAYVTGEVKTVKYFADGTWPLGESSNPDDLFKVSYEFVGVDKERSITVRGYDSEGLQIEAAEHTISFTPSNVGSGTVTMLKPDATAPNPVQFESNSTGVITKVAYYVGLSGGGVYHLDTILQSPYTLEREFSELGDRIVFAYGLNDDDFIIDMAFKNITVIKQAGGTVSITSPSANSTIKNPVTLEATVTGDVAVVEFKEGTTVLKRLTRAPFNMLYTFSAGSHTVTATGFDAGGNVIAGATDSVSFSIEQEVVESNISVISPTAPQNAGQATQFQVSITGLITQIRYIIEGQTYGPFNTAPFTHSHIFNTPGNFTVSIEGLDGSGKPVAATTTSVFVQGGNPNISLELTSFENGDDLSNPVFLQFTASNEIVAIEIFDNDAPLLKPDGFPYGQIRRPFQIKDHVFKEGKHTLLIQGYNISGNVVKTTFVTFTINSSIFLEPTSFENGDDLSNPVFLQFTASNEVNTIEILDNDSPLLKPDGTPYGRIHRPFQIENHVFKGEKHTLLIKGYNVAGEVVKTAFVAFTVDADSGSDDGCNYGGNTPVQWLLLLIPLLWIVRRRKELN